MTTSNLTTVLTATLPSATSTVLGGVQVQSGSGLLVDSSGNISVDSTQFLTVSSASSTYAPKSAPTFSGTVNSTGPIRVTNSSIGPAALIKIDGQYINFAINGNAGGGIVFPDGTTQQTAYLPTSVYSLNGAINNIDTLVSTLSSGNPSLASGENCIIIDYTTVQSGTLNLNFPQPQADGHAFELVIINGSGTYTASGVALDGVTSASFYLSLGTGVYTKGVFRYVDSTKTWYQVS